MVSVPPGLKRKTASMSSHAKTQPAPDRDEEPYVTKLRQKLKDLLEDLRKGAEGTIKKD